MQLLQKLRERAGLASFTRLVEDLEREASRVSETIEAFLTGSRKPLIIAYNRQGYLPASTALWHVSTVDPELNVFISDVPAVSLYGLAYREGWRILVFASNPYAGLLNIMQVARLLNHEMLTVTVKPADERVKSILDRYNPVYIDRGDELEASLVMAFAVNHALSGLYKGKLEARGARLFQHSREGFVGLVDELVERYSDPLAKILSLEDAVITSSKLMEAPSLFLNEALRRVGLKTRYEYAESVTGPGNLVLVSTSVEEYYVRELKFKYARMGLKAFELMFNTDPLEAGLYLALLSLYVDRLRIL
ncbi:MAG: hypothetical protein QXH45_01085 [Thermosphaera sp.]